MVVAGSEEVDERREGRAMATSMMSVTEIASGVFAVTVSPKLVTSNAYLVQSGRRVLVDSGWAGDRRAIVRAADRAAPHRDARRRGPTSTPKLEA
jgi:glyoxylase-like metal-dependent hydrolase (beta-lactamase superfamily II)